MVVWGMCMTRLQRDKYLKKKYGIGIKEYYIMLRAQKGVCAVCKKKPKPGKNLHVDHDHVSGEVRGLLDYFCNRRIIGRNKEETVRKLVAYLMPKYRLEENEFWNHKVFVGGSTINCCNCLLCIRREINSENKLYKPKS
jgi:hypothetical protein